MITFIKLPSSKLISSEYGVSKKKNLWLDIGTCFDTPKFRCNSGKNMNIYVIGLPLIMGHTYALSY